MALCEAHLLFASIVLCHPHRSQGLYTPPSTLPPYFLQVVHITRPPGTPIHHWTPPPSHHSSTSISQIDDGKSRSLIDESLKDSIEKVQFTKNDKIQEETDESMSQRKC